jgi:hypothetical protein
MEDLTKYTPTELLKMSNDIVAKHEALKKDIINDSIIIDDMEKKINQKLEQLDKLEKGYVAIVEELNNR